MNIEVINLSVSARLNREVKQTLETDWSDKQEAYSLDDQCGRFNNRSTNTQRHPSSAVLQDQCVPNLVPYFSSVGVTQLYFHSTHIQAVYEEHFLMLLAF